MARRLRTVVLILASGIFTSCSFAPERPGDLIGRYVFDVYDENHAWKYTLHGFYIDQDGRVFQYDRGDDRWVPSPERGGRIPEADIVEKFTNAKLVDAVGGAVLREQAKLLPIAAKGGITKLSASRDRGRLAYTGLIYDAEMRSYRVVVLGAEGDWLETNSSPAAQALMEWLKDVKHRIAERQQQ